MIVNNDSKNKIRWLLDDEKAYYLFLGIVTVVGAFVLMFRARLGVDITDETWYISDPYWVAKGSIPYVNNWTQASGFTLPLFVFYYLFLGFANGSEGIVLFSRLLFCVWKPMVVFISFALFKKAKMMMPPILALPIMVFNAGQLYTINYNTIGLVYSFLAFSILSVILSLDDSDTCRKRFIFGFFCGILMGRCVIGTPFTIVICISIFALLLIKNKYNSMWGYIAGGGVAAITVVSFCCIRGGIRDFIIGIQYFIKDNGYWSALDLYGVTVAENTKYLIDYCKPAFLMLLFLALFSKILYRKEIYNYLIVFLSCLFIIITIYGLTKYSGTGVSIAYATKFGWVVPIACSFFYCESEKKKVLLFWSYFTITIVCTYILAGYISAYGIESRSYWNFIPSIIGVYTLYVSIPSDKSSWKNCYKIGVLLVCMVITCLVVRGNYMFVYRDATCDNLNTKVMEGVWMGCITTPERRNAIENVERELKKRTNNEDQVLCWGGWACFMNLMCNGKLCSASPLGIGEINGFDYWHMYQVVPNKVFVNVDMDDRGKLLSDKRNVWTFITLFYTQKDEIRYESYDIYGEAVNYRIIEYDLSDRDGAISYVNRMASKVFEP